MRHPAADGVRFAGNGVGFFEDKASNSILLEEKAVFVDKRIVENTGSPPPDGLLVE